eukprot:12638-Heterococcus_DN1.PRE.1
MMHRQCLTGKHWAVPVQLQGINVCLLSNGSGGTYNAGLQADSYERTVTYGLKFIARLSY